jgi:hypothetical protein
MRTLCMARQSTFYRQQQSEGDVTCAFSSMFLAEWENIPTMATPVGTNIGQRFKSMWDSMIQFFLVRIL